MEHVINKKVNKKFKDNTKATKIIYLIFWFLACYFFMVCIAPQFDKLESVKPLVDFIEERDIDAGALYYTEIDEFFEANIHMKNTMDYMPKIINKQSPE